MKQSLFSKENITYLIIGAVAGGIIIYLVTKVFTFKAAIGEKAMKLIPLPEDTNALSVLRQIRDDARSQIPEGEAYDDEETITSAITMLDGHYEGHGQPDLNWTSFDLVNNGPDPVYVCVNKWTDPEAPVGVGQSINIDLKQKYSIKKVYLKCDTGNTANVGIHIVR